MMMKNDINEMFRCYFNYNKSDKDGIPRKIRRCKKDAEFFWDWHKRYIKMRHLPYTVDHHRYQLFCKKHKFFGEEPLSLIERVEIVNWYDKHK